MKKIFIIFLTLFAASYAHAQSSPQLPNQGVTITQAIPASPDAAALGKYGSIPVSLYTGVPNISIPLYTIKSGGISLPISLSYHAGGNKVEEIASSVGLGWALNAGGAITRTIRGYADETLRGLLDNCHCMPNLVATMKGDSSLTNQEVNTYFNQIADGSMDGEADMYNYNFAGYSGKFVMDGYGNIMTIPQQRIKFTFTLGTNPDGEPMISAFSAVTPDGTTYLFGSDNDGNNALELTKNYSNCGPNTKPRFYATSWFIKKIVDPTGHEIDFIYNSESYGFNQTASDTRYQHISDSNPSSVAPSMPEQICTGINVISGVKLKTIVFENGQISFHASPRSDVSGSSMIDSLQISSIGFSKYYRMYYTNNSSSRLRLDSLIGELDYISDIAPRKERYSFQYSPDSWPGYLSYSQDYWGYFNGIHNPTMLPSTTIQLPSGEIQELPGADRSSVEAPMLGGMLTKMTYPTGGYTLFTYEANRSNKLPNNYSSAILGPVNTVAKSNDTTNYYYNYDNINGNPEDLFTISYPDATLVPLHMVSSGLVTNDCNTDCVRAWVNRLDASGNTMSSIEFKNNDTTVYVVPGNYQLQVSDPKHQAYNPTTNPTGQVLYTLYATWQNEDTVTYKSNYIVGGVRIKQIADYDGVNSKPYNVKAYKYTIAGQIYSSGMLDFQPIYYYNLGINTGDLWTGLVTHNYFVQTSVSNYPLATTQGSVVGYSDVTELDGLNGQNGKIEYYYTTSQDSPDLQTQFALNPGFQADYGFPFTPTTNQDWKRGLLCRQITWKNAGSNVYSKIQDKVFNYTTLYADTAVNFKSGFTIKPGAYDENALLFNGTYPDGRMSAARYYDFTDFTYQSGETITDYDPADTTKFTKTVTSYQVDSTTLLTSGITSNNSKNELISTTATYSGNYNTSGATGNASMQGLKKLQQLGIISYPVEEITTKSNADGTNKRTIKAVLSTYKSTLPVGDSVYEMRSTAPLTSFTAASPGSTYIQKDSHYQPVVAFNKYDASGNILQENKIGDALHTYIWGYAYYNPPYNNTYPVAEVINADSASVAYTNFESYGSSGFGNWVYSNAGATTDATAPMGAGCYTVSSTNTLAKTGLNTSATYVVSFWTKSGASITVTGGAVANVATGNPKSGWTYHEYSITGTTTVTVGGTGTIDEVRLYPSTAQMSTYTYLPLVGVASKCDTKNDITYYVYDNIGRLIQLLDQNRNIIKAYQYHYQNSGQ